MDDGGWLQIMLHSIVFTIELMRITFRLRKIERNFEQCQGNSLCGRVFNIAFHMHAEMRNRRKYFLHHL